MLLACKNGGELRCVRSGIMRTEVLKVVFVPVLPRKISIISLILKMCFDCSLKRNFKLPPESTLFPSSLENFPHFSYELPRVSFIIIIGHCKKLWCCLVFNLFFLLIFLLVCCKQGLVAEAEAVLSFIIF